MASVQEIVIPTGNGPAQLLLIPPQKSHTHLLIITQITHLYNQNCSGMGFGVLSMYHLVLHSESCYSGKLGAPLGYTCGPYCLLGPNGRSSGLCHVLFSHLKPGCLSTGVSSRVSWGLHRAIRADRIASWVPMDGRRVCVTCSFPS